MGRRSVDWSIKFQIKIWERIEFSAILSPHYSMCFLEWSLEDGGLRPLRNFVKDGSEKESILHNQLEGRSYRTNDY